MQTLGIRCITSASQSRVSQIISFLTSDLMITAYRTYKALCSYTTDPVSCHLVELENMFTILLMAFVIKLKISWLFEPPRDLWMQLPYVTALLSLWVNYTLSMSCDMYLTSVLLSHTLFTPRSYKQFELFCMETFCSGSKPVYLNTYNFKNLVELR